MNREFMLYFGASLLALIADYGTLYVFTEFVGLHYLTSASFGFVVGIGVVYLASTLWVFGYRKYQRRALEFIIFLAIGVAGLLLNDAIMWASTELAGVHYLLSKCISAGFVFCFNFFARRFFLFCESTNANPT